MEVRKYHTLIQKGFTIGPRKLQTSESYTSIVCKLMEFIIRASVTSHFNLNHLFSNKQFDFNKRPLNFLATVADSGQMD